MSPPPSRAKHDEAYKLLFSSAAMVEDLLFHILPDFAKLVDWPTLRMLSSSFVKPEGLRQRHADMLWSARLREHGAHPVYLALEFQSTPVSNMAFRVREYVGLMLREAELAANVGSVGQLPIVLPSVIYNGKTSWNAATDLADWLVPGADPALGEVLGLQMRRKYILVDLKAISPLDLRPHSWFSVLAEWEGARWAKDATRLAELWRLARESGDDGIVRGFDALRQQIAPWLRIQEAAAREPESRKKRKTMIRHEETWLADNLRKRDEELRREGRQEGRREGRQEGRREGRESLLRQLAFRKFGPDGVAALSHVLEARSDLDRTEILAEAIIECETVAELIARTGEL